MDHETYLPLLKAEVDAAYGKKSRTIVERNWQAIDATVAELKKNRKLISFLTIHRFKNIANVGWFGVIAAAKQRFRFNFSPLSWDLDFLQFSDLIENGMLGGVMPSGTAAYEKRGIALEVPEWIPEACTMCNECAFIQYSPPKKLGYGILSRLFRAYHG
jgi:pyruvate-ferredoxin/flavodoxin oxidoreductase